MSVLKKDLKLDAVVPMTAAGSPRAEITENSEEGTGSPATPKAPASFGYINDERSSEQAVENVPDLRMTHQPIA